MGKKISREPSVKLGWRDLRLKRRRLVRKLLWVHVKTVRAEAWDSAVGDEESRGPGDAREGDGGWVGHGGSTQFTLSAYTPCWSASSAPGRLLSRFLWDRMRSTCRQGPSAGACMSYPCTGQARPTGLLLRRGPGACCSEHSCEEQNQNWS